MDRSTHIEGDHNIVIQGVDESSIAIEVNGETKEIQRQLKELKELLLSQRIQSFQSGHRVYDINSLNESNFELILARLKQNIRLPEELSHFQITDRNAWIRSLKEEFIKRGDIAVANRPMEIIQHYGWIIAENLRKTFSGLNDQEDELKILSYLTEAWQSSLRYLSYIQIAQYIKERKLSEHPLLPRFINMEDEYGEEEQRTKMAELDYDYLTLLSTLSLPSETAFVPEVNEFIDELLKVDSQLFSTALFLGEIRSKLVNQSFKEGEDYQKLLNEYLNGLVYWLRKLAFLAKYRLVSIKDIGIKYRLGTKKEFVHLYGELHGMYDQSFMLDPEEDYMAYKAEDFFTYNQSILLFQGHNVVDSLGNLHDTSSYLSLSPLLIDLSVFEEKKTHTPEIYYYIGQRKKAGKEFNYALYKNELSIDPSMPLASNKTLAVKAQNTERPKLNELHEHLQYVFESNNQRAS